MAPDLLGPPSKKRRLSADGEAVAEASRTTPSSSSQLIRQKKLPPIARQYVSPDAASILPAEVIEPLLEQSIALILKSFGFDGGSRLALNNIRFRAGQYLQDMTTNAMKYCSVQRRTRPTITDFEEALKHTGYFAADLEDEVTRYRKSLAASTLESGPTAPNGTSRLKPHIYTLPNPDPPPREEPALQELLGSELLKPRKRYKVPIPPRPAYMSKLEQENPTNPKFQSQTKPAVSVVTERPYIDPHHPPWPSKHTYERHEEVREITRDAKKIRELASEEARQSGETLRKLLAEFSKVSTVRKSGGGGGGEVNGATKKNPNEIYKGGNARQARDDMFDKTWDAMVRAMEVEKEEEKLEAERQKKERRDKRERMRGGINMNGTGMFGSSGMMDLDEYEISSSESEADEAEQELEIDEKGLLDTVVNCEKSLWPKGGLRRVMIR
ncbi:hypothetical protein ABW19_dt0207482 [Dactylella cylindrospora]|nr:hypothetical protein ABW19_dt0207482 [Dactylella cylindrospora]